MRKISDFQKSILIKMTEGHTLSNHYQTETALYRYTDGMSGGWIETRFTSKYIPYRTIAVLVSQGLIEESKRYKSGITMQGDNTWDTYTISYQLTEQGKKAAQ